MKKTYFRRKYQFISDSNEYTLFLKEHMFEVQPKYFTLERKAKIETPDGEMYGIVYSNDIVNPNTETIARCGVNNEFIFFWRDHCWGIAVNKYNQSVIKEISDDGELIPYDYLDFNINKVTNDETFIRNFAVIFKIGGKIDDSSD